MEPVYIQIYQSPLGSMMLGSYRDALCLCDWQFRKMRKSIDLRIQAFLGAEYQEGSSRVIEQAIQELEAYFNGTRTTFTVPLLLAGSDFQKQVWIALQEIPYGKTLTYLQLSEKIGNPLAIRAVASANGANALSILVPCHRVVGSDGALTGYAGGLPAKRKLLELEGVIMTLPFPEN